VKKEAITEIETALRLEPSLDQETSSTNTLYSPLCISTTTRIDNQEEDGRWRENRLYEKPSPKDLNITILERQGAISCNFNRLFSAP
jgi:hypothetical protein